MKNKQIVQLSPSSGGGGGSVQLYEHMIQIYVSHNVSGIQNSIYLYLRIINKSSNPMTISDFIKYLANRYRTDNYYVDCQGWVKSRVQGNRLSIIGIRAVSSSDYTQYVIGFYPTANAQSGDNDYHYEITHTPSAMDSFNDLVNPL